MQDLLKQVSIKVNKNIFIKDPESSDLGKNIIRGSIELIDEVGIEHFTFKKLAEILNTTESSIYRYFENKHMLLVYLTTWYWGWLEYKLVFSTANISDPEQELKNAVKVLCEYHREDSLYPHINIYKLNNIAISESSKVYLTKEVDQENKLGFFNGYDRICDRISDIIVKLNNSFKYPHTLTSTCIEGILRQKFFVNHLPSLTDIKNDENELIKFFTHLMLKSISR